jgi:hypothetical protein
MLNRQRSQVAKARMERALGVTVSAWRRPGGMRSEADWRKAPCPCRMALITSAFEPWDFPWDYTGPKWAILVPRVPFLYII